MERSFLRTTTARRTLRRLLAAAGVCLALSGCIVAPGYYGPHYYRPYRYYYY